jgi:hypothetical protein
MWGVLHAFPLSGNRRFARPPRVTTGGLHHLAGAFRRRRPFACAAVLAAAGFASAADEVELADFNGEGEVVFNT